MKAIELINIGSNLLKEKNKITHFRLRNITFQNIE